MELTSNGIVRFGVFEADVDARELRKQGLRVKLQDQPFQVLALLLERRGEIVTREELQRAIWPENTFVEFDHGLNTAVQKIRAALGDDASNPRFIETVPKRGYRFVANVAGPSPHQLPPWNERYARRGVLIGLGAVAAAIAVVFVTARGPDAAPIVTGAPRHFVIPSEGDVSHLSNRALISPDGRWIAYESGAGASSRGITLWLQNLERDKPRRIAGPGRLGLIGWSPDSKLLSYMADSDLFRLPAEGQEPVRIAPLDLGSPAQSGCWSPDGDTIILVPPGNARRLVEVQVRGGAYQTVLSLDDDSLGSIHSVTCLPGSAGSKRIVFDVARDAVERIVAADLDTGERREVLAGGRSPIYATSGHIVYQATKNTIMVVPFSAKTLAATGAPTQYRRGARKPSVSQNGTLAYLTRGGGSMQIVWRDRSGVEVGTVGQPQELLMHPALSPDGEWVAVRGEEDGVAALWLHEVARPTKKRISFGSWVDRSAWRPDGALIAYTGFGKAYDDIFVTSPDGSGEPIPVVSEGSGNYPYSWSSDGRHLLYTAFREPGWHADILRMEIDGDGKPLEETVILATEFDEYSPVLSPDDRFLAYSSDKSGRHEIYVRTYPSGDRDWLVSTNGVA